MSYTPTNWQNLPNTTTPLIANNLNKIETELSTLDSRTERAVYTLTPLVNHETTNRDYCVIDNDKITVYFNFYMKVTSSTPRTITILNVSSYFLPKIRTHCVGFDANGSLLKLFFNTDGTIVIDNYANSSYITVYGQISAFRD